MPCSFVPFGDGDGDGDVDVDFDASRASLSLPTPLPSTLARMPDYGGVENVAGFEPADIDAGSYDLGMTFGRGGYVCNYDGVSASHRVAWCLPPLVFVRRPMSDCVPAACWPFASGAPSTCRHLLRKVCRHPQQLDPSFSSLRCVYVVYMRV